MTSEPPIDLNSGATYFILTLLELDKKRALLTTLAGKQVEVTFESCPTLWVAKDLGKWARRNLGMHGRTDPGEFTQIVWKDQVLGLNQPLALLLEEGQEGKERALRNCTFCFQPLREESYTSSPYPMQPAPFPNCYFCEDEPAWHHGWCCPQNAASSMYRGPTHADRTSRMIWARLFKESLDGDLN